MGMRLSTLLAVRPQLAGRISGPSFAQKADQRINAVRRGTRSTVGANGTHQRLRLGPIRHAAPSLSLPGLQRRNGGGEVRCCQERHSLGQGQREGAVEHIAASRGVAHAHLRRWNPVNAASKPPKAALPAQSDANSRGNRGITHAARPPQPAASAGALSRAAPTCARRTTAGATARPPGSRRRLTAGPAMSASAASGEAADRHASRPGRQPRQNGRACARPSSTAALSPSVAGSSRTRTGASCSRCRKASPRRDAATDRPTNFIPHGPQPGPQGDRARPHPGSAATGP